MFKSVILCSMVLGGVVLVGCKKDETPPPAPDTGKKTPAATVPTTKPTMGGLDMTGGPATRPASSIDPAMPPMTVPSAGELKLPPMPKIDIGAATRAIGAGATTLPTGGSDGPNK